MNYYHFTNDLSFEINLSSVATGETLDPSVIRQVRLFTRKNGRVYCACFGNNTLINNGNTLTVVLNNHGLEPGVLQYVVEMQIPDPIYPDNFKKVSQFYVSEIELVKGQGQTDYADVQAMYGTTIDSKFQDMELELDNLDEDVQDIQATIVSVQEINSVQDASINRIEDIISTIDGGTSGSIDRLDTSVNALSRDVSTLNHSVDTLSSEQEIMSQNLSNVTNTVNDVSTRVDGFESALANKADVSVLGNYYTTGETYTKTEVDRAIADAALDGQLPAGVVVDADYVHTDNNYTTEDKNKVRDFDLTGYPTNSSLVANYATKAELQNVDNNHPTNASVNSNYLKKSELANELSDYVQNASLVANYATKAQIQGCLDEDEVYGILEDYPTNSSVSDNYVHWLYANENYVSYENIDEIIINTVDNNYTFQNKVIDVINTSTAVKDIPVLSTNIQNVSTKLTSDYLTANTINNDFVKNASLNASLGNYLLTSTAQTTYATKDDISTFKSIVFCTQEEYDALVDSSTVDANTVYMLNGDQIAGDYLTPNDISTFITSNDVSIYATTAYVDTQIGNIQNILATI